MEKKEGKRKTRLSESALLCVAVCVRSIVCVVDCSVEREQTKYASIYYYYVPRKESDAFLEGACRRCQMFFFFAPMEMVLVHAYGDGNGNGGGGSNDGGGGSSGDGSSNATHIIIQL